MKKNILIVDDDRTASHLLKLALEQTEAFTVQVENCSGAALPLARQWHPDLIILDVCMPGKNGGDVAAEIRADPQLHAVPIIFLTSIVSEKESGGQPIISGGFPFLAKPVQVGKLVQLIDRTLAAKAEPAHAPAH